MYSAQKQIHAEIGDGHAQNGEDAINVEEQRLLEGFPNLFVKRGGVNEQGDECPNLLWVPRPIVAPRNVGPNGSDEDASRQQRHGGIEHRRAEAFHPFQTKQVFRSD